MRSVDLRRNSFIRSFIGALAPLITTCWGLGPTYALDQDVLPNTLYPVGMTQVEYIDPAQGSRPLDYMLIYPAAADGAAAPFKVFLSANLRLYKDAPVVAD